MTNPTPPSNPMTPPPADELDGLLRTWHAENATRAEAGRDRLLSSLSRPAAPIALQEPWGVRLRGTMVRSVRRPEWRLAASVALLALIVTTLVPWTARVAVAKEILVPAGGQLEALDEAGRVLGPCPLEQTDVDIEVAGRVSRVTVRQAFHNPYDDVIEAVYTFPLSHDGAVDRMTMTIGDRVIVGRVKPRGEAREIYEAARAQGHVAALLEQERTNVFTQSVANIMPGTKIVVEISYVELVEVRDGEHRLHFPMVVAPRYIPGRPASGSGHLPAELARRHGLVLRGPARVTIDAPAANVEDPAPALTEGRLNTLLAAARPIEVPGPLWWGEGHATSVVPVWREFRVTYADGLIDEGILYTDGTGRVDNRWFYADPALTTDMGTGFAVDTDQVPDASRITPMPVPPTERAGHDISVRVRIDTGGPAIVATDSESHEVVTVVPRREAATRAEVTLRRERTIPNRDFLFTWRVADERLEDAHFAHRGPGEDGFVTLMLTPPARPEAATIVPRELIFVLDSSGSMKGFPIEKAKTVMIRALDTMRPGDTFNVITFNNSFEWLWPASRPATDEHRLAAQKHIDQRQGGGGTEMRPAVVAAMEGNRSADPEAPARYVFLLTDGEIGNDGDVVGAVAERSHLASLFTLGIGSSPNRALLDGMARAGRGATDAISPEGKVDEAVARFARRISTPVLTNIEIAFDQPLGVYDTIPALDAIPDLFDETPIVLHGRYRGAGTGFATVRGRTAGAAFERRIPITLAEVDETHDVAATMWARAKVESLALADDVEQITALGVEHQIMTKHTSFVAVEATPITIDGEPRLVVVPIEMPAGQSWEGTFGDVAPMEAGLRFSVGATFQPGPTGAAGLSSYHRLTEVHKYAAGLQRGRRLMLGRTVDRVASDKRAHMEALGQRLAKATRPTGRYDWSGNATVVGGEAMGGGGGFGGGGSGGGGGGSLFGDPANDTTYAFYALTADQPVAPGVEVQLADAVTSVVRSDLGLIDGRDTLELQLGDTYGVARAYHDNAAVSEEFFEEIVQQLTVSSTQPSVELGYKTDAPGLVVPVTIDPDGAGKETPLTQTIVTYGVGDLIGREGPAPLDDATASVHLSALVDVIRTFVDIDGWEANGGETGHLSVVSDRLLVRQTEANHRALQTLLTQLRLAFGLPVGDSFVEEATRRQAAEPSAVTAPIVLRPTDITDELGEGAAEILAGALTSTVTPDIWAPNGGPTLIQPFRDAIVVEAAPEIVTRIRAFFDQVRQEQRLLEAYDIERLMTTLDRRLWTLLEPELRAYLRPDAPAETPATEVNVSVVANSSGRRVRRGLAEIGLVVTGHGATGHGDDHLIVGRIAPHRLDELARHASVRWVAPLTFP